MKVLLEALHGPELDGLQAQFGALDKREKRRIQPYLVESWIKALYARKPRICGVRRKLSLATFG